MKLLFPYTISTAGHENVKWVGPKIACTVDFNDLRTPFRIWNTLSEWIVDSVVLCVCIYMYIHTNTRTLAKLWSCTVNDKWLIFFWTSVISDRLSDFRPLRGKENSPRWTKVTTISIIIIVIAIISSPSFSRPLGCSSPWLFSSINPTQAVEQFGWRYITLKSFCLMNRR